MYSTQESGLLHRELVVGKKIGSGSFGSLHEAEYLCAAVAVKIV